MVTLLNDSFGSQLSTPLIKLLSKLVQLVSVVAIVIQLFSAKTTLLPPNCQISYSLRAKIATKLRHDISAKTIAYEEGVSASTVNRMLSHTRSEFRNNFNFLPLHLCFDEFRGTHNSYHFICLDSDNHVIQTILPNRFKRYYHQVFYEIPRIRQTVSTHR